MVGGDSDPSNRAPMYWNADLDDGTTTTPPGCILPSEGYPLGSYEEQKDDDSSIYNYYREAIAIRNAIPAIARGTQKPEDALNEGCISALRKTWGDKECIILFNLDKQSNTCDLSAYADWDMVASLSVNEERVALDGTSLNMPASSIAILTPKN